MAIFDNFSYRSEAIQLTGPDGNSKSVIILIHGGECGGVCEVWCEGERLDISVLVGYKVCKCGVEVVEST